MSVNLPVVAVNVCLYLPMFGPLCQKKRMSAMPDAIILDLEDSVPFGRKGYRATAYRVGRSN